jgi:hypothetical protein
MGWFFLLAHLGLGAWIATNAREDQIKLFLKTLIFFAMAVFLAQSVIVFAQIHPRFMESPLAEYYIYFIAGLMANRNAYALFFLAIIVLITVFCLGKTKEEQNLLPSKILYFTYFSIPFFLAFNGSRAGLISLCAVVLVLFFLKRKNIGQIARCALFIALGLIALLSIYHGNRDKLLAFGHQNLEVFQIAHKKQDLETLAAELDYGGDSMRVTILKDALPMILERPLIGSGLGAVMMDQEKNHGKLINLIDSTPVWLLVETGLIGLLVFAFFYLTVVRSLLTQVKKDESEFSQNFRIALLLIILGFSVFCLFHEVTYARHMWFLLGMGLCLPARTRRDEYSS